MDNALYFRAAAACRASAVCALLFLTACGGGPAPDSQASGTDAMHATTRVSYAPDQERPVQAMPVRTKAVYQVDSSSFTVSPTSQFKGFNHGMWNGPRSWTECDCGSEPAR